MTIIAFYDFMTDFEISRKNCERLTVATQLELKTAKKAMRKSEKLLSLIP